VSRATARTLATLGLSIARAAALATPSMDVPGPAYRARVELHSHVYMVASAAWSPTPAATYARLAAKCADRVIAAVDAWGAL